jgi:hypothetical protein
MISLWDIIVVIGMFVLRIGAPLGIVLALGYFLKRLDARWEAEARMEQGEAKPAALTTVPSIAPGLARRLPADVPGQQLPFVPGLGRQQQPGVGLAPGQQLSAGPGLVGQSHPGLALKPGQHCWDVKGCSAEAKARCPAAKSSGAPCWQARLKAEGQIPETCLTCNIFQSYPLM